MKYTLNVNGRTRVVDVPADMPLLCSAATARPARHGFQWG